MTINEHNIYQAIEVLRKPRSRRDLVYVILSLVPIGKVVSYSAIAFILKTSPRTVAQYLARNPYAPLIPCHRVVRKNGTLGGYTPGGLAIKRRLLELEGVSIVNDKIPKHTFHDNQLLELIS